MSVERLRWLFWTGGNTLTITMTVSKLMNHNVTKVMPPKTQYRKHLEVESLR